MVEASATATLRQVYAPVSEAPCQLANEGMQIARLVGCVDGHVVGTLRYWISGDRLHVLGLGVHESYRRQGVTRAMIEHLAGLARAQGLARLSLYTIRQTSNVPIFERLGFRIVSEEPATLLVSPTHEPLSEVYMERPAI